MDERYRILRERVEALTVEQLERVLAYPEEMVLDNVNYDGRFCALAVAFDLPREFAGKPVTDAVVRARIQELGERQMPGFEINPTKGVPGQFYTTDRARDLLGLVREVLASKRSSAQNAT